MHEHLTPTESDLLTTLFPANQNQVVLLTYTGKRCVTVREVCQYDLILQDGQEIKKIEVVMAFSTKDKAQIAPDLFIDEQIKALNQHAIEDIRDRRIVRMVVVVNNPVRITLRTGDVITGFVQAFSRFNILLNVNGAPVLIYKHGIDELKNLRTPKH